MDINPVTPTNFDQLLSSWRRGLVETLVDYFGQQADAAERAADKLLVESQQFIRDNSNSPNIRELLEHFAAQQRHNLVQEGIRVQVESEAQFKAVVLNSLTHLRWLLPLLG